MPRVVSQHLSALTLVHLAMLLLGHATANGAEQVVGVVDGTGLWMVLIRQWQVCCC